MGEISDAAWTAIGQFFILLGVVFGFWSQKKREEIRRGWDAEERVRQAAEVQRQFQIEADSLKQSTHQDANALLRQHAKTIGKLDENTEVSKKAFIEANRVNEKIAQLQNRFDKLLAREVSQVAEVEGIQELVNEAPRIRDIQKTVDATQQHLEEISESHGPPEK